MKSDKKKHRPKSARERTLLESAFPSGKLSHDSEIHPEDGLDPRELFGGDRRRNKPDRKALQLCRQVAETLAYVLSGACNDDLLRSLQVESVTPAPDISQLLVTVRPYSPDDAVAASLVLDRLQGVAGKLRCEVAAAITRRRVPKLLFCVLSPSGGGTRP